MENRRAFSTGTAENRRIGRDRAVTNPRRELILPTHPSRPSARLLTGFGALALALGLMAGMPAHAETPTAEDWAGLPADWRPAGLSRTLGFEMTSKNTGQRYRILVGLPHRAPLPSGYPTLWMLDGLASYPIAEYVRPRPVSAGQSAQWVAKKLKDTPAGLVIGVGYASGDPFDVNARALDYTPVPAGRTGDQFSSEHGGAAAFLKFLTEELRPLIARYFPMNPRQHSLFGFSYGGLFAVHTLLTEPGHFQRYWAASPSLWFGERQLLRQLPERLETLRFEQPTRLMITVGLDEQYPASFPSEEQKRHMQERAIVDLVRDAARRLEAARLPNLQVTARVVPEQDHLDMLMHGARRVVEKFAFTP